MVPQHDTVPAVPAVDDTFHRFVTILTEVAGVDPDVVRADSLLVDDLDLDSLTMVEVLVVVEDEFRVHIGEKEQSALRTVGDAVVQIDRAAVA